MDDFKKPSDEEFLADLKPEELEDLSDTSDGLEDLDDTSDGLEEVSDTSGGFEEAVETSKPREKEANRFSDEDFFTHQADSEEQSQAPAEPASPESFDDVPLSEEAPEPTDEEPEEDEDEEPAKPSLIDQIKALPRRTQIIAGAAAGMLVLAVAAYFIFGGEDDKKKRRAAAPRPAPQVPAPAATGPEEAEEPAEEEPDEPTADPEESTEETAEETPEEEEVPKRPEDFVQWKPADYVAARQEGDPRLVEAVTHLGTAYRGNANAAQVAELLVGLLAPLEPDEPAEPGTRSVIRRPARPGTAGGLTEAVVAALVNLENSRAQQLLARLLSGELPTEDDAATVATVLSTLAANLRPANEGLLYRAFTDAERIRPAGRGDVSAEELRRLTYETLIPVASEKFRIEMAKYLMQPTTPVERREEFSEMLLAEEPKNVAAQLYMWQSGRLEDDTREGLRNHFLARSTALLAHVLDVPAEPVGTGRRTTRRPSRRPSRGEPDEPVDEAAVQRRMAELLWGQWFIGQLVPKLKGVESFEDSAELLVLASTVPADAMRAAVFDALEDNWEQGPEALESAGFDGEVLLDPALLLCIKALPRSAPREGLGRSRSRTGGRSSGAVPKTFQEKEEAQQAWMLTCETMVRSWCGRLHQASAAQAEAARLAGRTPPRDHAIGSLARRAGFAVHEGANVTAEYHHEYPGKFAQGIPGLPPGPVVVDYLRIEEESKLLSMLGYYRRQMRFRDALEVEDGVWCDQTRVVSGSDRQRSLDMLITRVEPSDEQNTDEPEPLVLEILVVEARDPTGG